jgi:hypothetical protein
MDLGEEIISQRLHGPVLSGLTTNSLFAGKEAENRMTNIRSNITEIRSIWQTPSAYNALVTRLQHTMYNDKQSLELKREIATIIGSFHDWADFQCERPYKSNAQPWAFIELYASRDGYVYLWRLFNDILRDKDADPNKLLAAAFLTEILTIELYNLRLSNIGDPLYANYQGKVFRGLSVSQSTVSDFRKAASNPKYSDRVFSIPLGFISSTTAENTMKLFAEENPGEEQMRWVIHIHGLDPELLRRYEQRYPDSVVSSICAMPIARVAEFGEREILLRGAWFHIVNMESKMEQNKWVHTVEMVMLNTNRDHITELAMHVGEKMVQRNYFNDIVRVSRYEILTSLTRGRQAEDCLAYTELGREALQRVKRVEIEMTEQRNDKLLTYNLDLAKSWSGPMATWIGDRTGQSFPKNYLNQRIRFHKAAAEGQWNVIMEILEREYETRQADWFNVRALDGEPKTFCDHMTIH